MKTLGIVTLEDLMPFCSNPSRNKIATPWRYKDMVAATDGRILVLVDGSNLTLLEVTRTDGPSLESFKFDHDSLPDEKYTTIAPVDVPMVECKHCNGKGKNKTCPDCNGEGEVECECSDCGHVHEAECRTCGGEGILAGGEDVVCEHCGGTGKTIDKTKEGILIGCNRYSHFYLNLIQKHLKNPVFEMDIDSCGAMRFKFDGGLGYLMPVTLR